MKRGFEVVKRLEGQDIQIPSRGTNKSAGYDFYLLEDITIKAKSSIKIKTGIKSYMQDDEFLSIYVRSSIGIKGIILKNIVGIIDADYYGNDNNDGEIIFFLENLSDTDFSFQKGDRLAQGIFQQYLLVDNDETKEQRIGGYGSTN